MNTESDIYLFSILFVSETLGGFEILLVVMCFQPCSHFECLENLLKFDTLANEFALVGLVQVPTLTCKERGNVE
jgi:hypothetical protein